MLRWNEHHGPDEHCQRCADFRNCTKLPKLFLIAEDEAYVYAIIQYNNGKIRMGFEAKRSKNEPTAIGLVVHSIDEAKQHMQIIADGFNGE